VKAVTIISHLTKLKYASRSLLLSFNFLSDITASSPTALTKVSYHNGELSAQLLSQTKNAKQASTSNAKR